MKLAINKIPYDKKIEIKIDWDIEGINSIRPVKGYLMFSRNQAYVSVKGKVNTLLKLKCSTCLNTYFWPIEVNIKENLTFEHPTTRTVQVQLLKNCDMDYISGDNFINISNIIYESVILAIPMVNLCSNDCQGISFKKKQENSVDPRLLKLKDFKNNQQD